MFPSRTKLTPDSVTAEWHRQRHIQPTEVLICHHWEGTALHKKGTLLQLTTAGAGDWCQDLPRKPCFLENMPVSQFLFIRMFQANTHSKSIHH
ncbi:hypothetical protein V5799_010816 [Amblyomma americanum]|uniref:Uncharacterized protein n=1 Tax=Amblyomma americanum TaxID=6943 RepID=A0AAQ4EIW7_AMBAM